MLLILKFLFILLLMVRAEINIKPWNLFLEETRNASESLKWKDRAPYAFWKGNPGVVKTRQDLMQCNLSNGHDWNARLFAQVP